MASRVIPLGVAIPAVFAFIVGIFWAIAGAIMVATPDMGGTEMIIGAASVVLGIGFFLFGLIRLIR